MNPAKEKPEYAEDEPVTFLPMAAVEEEFGGVAAPERRRFSEVKSGYTQFKSGDVLFAKITPCMENGKVAIVPDIDPPHGYGSTEFFVVRPDARSVEVRWVARYLAWRDFRRQAQHNMRGAAGQLRVPKTWFKQVELPVPPRPRQRAIVAKIEQLFSELDAGEAALKRAQRNLERYRASLLKAAVEGKLTEEWRKTNPPEETGEELLQRTLAERRKRWAEDYLSKYEAKGKKPPKNWRSKYEEPKGADTEDLPELPEGWCWAALGQLTSRLTSGSRDWKPYYGRGTGVFILAGNVKPGRLDLAEKQHVDPPADDPARRRSQVNEGDILVTIVGANTGDVCRVARPLHEHYVCQSVSLVRLTMPGSSAFVDLVLNSPWGRGVFAEFMYGEGRPHLSFDQLRSTPVPLPPAAEQDRIVGAFATVEASIGRVLESVGVRLASGRALRRGILAKAFDGSMAGGEDSHSSAAVQDA